MVYDSLEENIHDIALSTKCCEQRLNFKALHHVCIKTADTTKPSDEKDIFYLREMLDGIPKRKEIVVFREARIGNI